jgi:hypothetical protein
MHIPKQGYNYILHYHYAYILKTINPTFGKLYWFFFFLNLLNLGFIANLNLN